MPVLSKIKRAFRGDVKPTALAMEALRRGLDSLHERSERKHVDKYEARALTKKYARMSPDELLAHFRGPRAREFFNGFVQAETVELQRRLFPDETAQLIAAADRIVDDHCWPLLGFGERCFGKQIEWNRDPLSGYLWPLDYHRDVKLFRADGSDARVLWELNRLGHFITLARAYVVTRDERYATEFFTQLRSWSEQNPYRRGANWNCAMELALRTINLIGAFEVFRHSPQLDSTWLEFFLDLLQQHGSHIHGNLEFSHIATSNHYLSDLVGLTWLGVMLPEFRDSDDWDDFADQVMDEMSKQVLADGADFEASTGYHRFVLELLLYTFVLWRCNGGRISEKYWTKAHQMLIYLRGYLRPDGFAPLIGDTDSGQVLPIRRRRADDHAYLLAIGAVVFEDPDLKPAGMKAPEELLWLLGAEGVAAFEKMQSTNKYAVSQAFPQAGTYIMRDRDLYLCFNTSGAGIHGRGSHGHNDALSLEVSAGGRPFIVDPGTYVYSANRDKRHEFRSTAYHSTVKIDDVEQSTIDRQTPFVIGNEAKPRVLEWQTNTDSDKVVAEHYGYQRLSSPVTHRRSVTFDKRARSWLVEDEFPGTGEHVYEIRFHFAPGLDVKIVETAVEARDGDTSLRVSLSGSEVQPTLEQQPVSRDYGEISEAVSACWCISSRPGKLTWTIGVIRHR